MGVHDIIAGKRQWRAHQARVRRLPRDYQVVYQETQRYLFKVGPVDLADGTLLRDIVDLFEQGAANGQGVLEVTGPDVAAFADGLVDGAPTYADLYQESIRRGTSPGETDA